MSAPPEVSRMFRVLWPSRPQRKKAPPLRRLSLEQLEDRYCPAAPVLSPLQVVSDGVSVTISGQVLDENPESAMILLSGGVSGVAYADSSGQFSYTGAWQGVPVTSVWAMDQEYLSSAFETVVMEPPPPDLDPFLSFNVEYLENRQIRVTGQVTDEHPGGLSVCINGAAN